MNAPKEETGSFSWNLIFDQEPLKGNATADEIDDSNGMNFKMQARLNEEFIIVVPISGEKAKVL